MKRFYRLLIVFSVLILIALAAGGNYGGKLIVAINWDMYRGLKNKGMHIPTPSDYGLQSEAFFYTSKDGLKLKAYLVKTDIMPAKGTVLLVHGIRSGKEYYLPAAKLLADNGYNSVLVDLRAHGECEGVYCTYGFYEKQDISVLLDTLSNYKVDDNYGIWGNSLGAAVSLQAMSNDKRIKFGIIESTFADFRKIVHDYSERTIGFNIPVLNDYSIWWAELMAGFDAEEVKPSETAKNITQAILMVHGTVDANIKLDYGKENFRNLAGQNNMFVEVPGADHFNVWKVGGEAYFKEVIDFMDGVSMGKKIAQKGN